MAEGSLGTKKEVEDREAGFDWVVGSGSGGWVG